MQKQFHKEENKPPAQSANPQGVTKKQDQHADKVFDYEERYRNAEDQIEVQPSCFIDLEHEEQRVSEKVAAVLNESKIKKQSDGEGSPFVFAEDEIDLNLDQKIQLDHDQIEKQEQYELDFFEKDFGAEHNSSSEMRTGAAASSSKHSDINFPDLMSLDNQKGFEMKKLDQNHFYGQTERRVNFNGGTSLFNADMPMHQKSTSKDLLHRTAASSNMSFAPPYAKFDDNLDKLDDFIRVSQAQKSDEDLIRNSIRVALPPSGSGGAPPPQVSSLALPETSPPTDPRLLQEKLQLALGSIRDSIKVRDCGRSVLQTNYRLTNEVENRSMHEIMGQARSEGPIQAHQSRLDFDVNVPTMQDENFAVPEQRFAQDKEQEAIQQDRQQFLRPPLPQSLSDQTPSQDKPNPKYNINFGNHKLDEDDFLNSQSTEPEKYQPMPMLASQPLVLNNTTPRRQPQDSFHIPITRHPGLSVHQNQTFGSYEACKPPIQYSSNSGSPYPSQRDPYPAQRESQPGPYPNQGQQARLGNPNGGNYPQVGNQNNGGSYPYFVVPGGYMPMQHGFVPLKPANYEDDDDRYRRAGHHDRNYPGIKTGSSPMLKCLAFLIFFALLMICLEIGYLGWFAREKGGENTNAGLLKNTELEKLNETLRRHELKDLAHQENDQNLQEAHKMQDKAEQRAHEAKEWAQKQTIERLERDLKKQKGLNYPEKGKKTKRSINIDTDPLMKKQDPPHNNPQQNMTHEQSKQFSQMKSRIQKDKQEIKQLGDKIDSLEKNQEKSERAEAEKDKMLADQYKEQMKLEQNKDAQMTEQYKERIQSLEGQVANQSDNMKQTVKELKQVAAKEKKLLEAENRVENQEKDAKIKEMEQQKEKQEVKDAKQAKKYKYKIDKLQEELDEENAKEQKLSDESQAKIEKLEQEIENDEKKLQKLQNSKGPRYDRNRYKVEQRKDRMFALKKQRQIAHLKAQLKKEHMKNRKTLQHMQRRMKNEEQKDAKEIAKLKKEVKDLESKQGTQQNIQRKQAAELKLKEKQRKQLLRRYRADERYMAKQSKIIHEEKQEILDEKQQINKLQSKVSSIEKQHKDDTKEIREHDKIIKEDEKQLRQHDEIIENDERKLRQLKDKNQNLKSELRSTQSNYEEELEKVKEDSKEELKQFKKDAEEDFQRKEDEVEELELKLKRERRDADEDFQRIEDEVDGLEDKNDDLSDRLKKRNYQINKLKQQLTNLNKQHDHYIQQLKSQFEDQKQQELFDLQSSYEEQMQKMREKQEELANKVREKQDQINRQVQEKEQEIEDKVQEKQVQIENKMKEKQQELQETIKRQNERILGLKKSYKKWTIKKEQEMQEKMQAEMNKMKAEMKDLKSNVKDQMKTMKGNMKDQMKNVKDKSEKKHGYDKMYPGNGKSEYSDKNDNNQSLTDKMDKLLKKSGAMDKKQDNEDDYLKMVPHSKKGGKVPNMSKSPRDDKKKGEDSTKTDFEAHQSKEEKKRSASANLTHTTVRSSDQNKQKDESKSKLNLNVTLCASGEGSQCICESGTVFYGERYNRKVKLVNADNGSRERIEVDKSRQLSFEEMIEKYPYLMKDMTDGGIMTSCSFDQFAPKNQKWSHMYKVKSDKQCFCMSQNSQNGKGKWDY